MLGKASSTSNVTRLDMRIVNPDDGFRPIRNRGAARGRDSTTGGDSDGGQSNGQIREGGSDDDEMMGIEAMLVMKLLCKHGECIFCPRPNLVLQPVLSPRLSVNDIKAETLPGVTKKHSLHVGSSEFLRADVNPDSTPSGFVVDAHTLREWLDHFHIGLTTSSATSSGGSTTIKQENQLSWMFAKHEVRIKSWEGGATGLSTEMKVDPAEFVDYDVYNGQRVDLTFPMREFRVSAIDLPIRVRIGD